MMTKTPSLRDRFRTAVELRDAAALRGLLPEREALRDLIDAPIFGFDSPAIVAVSQSDDVDVIDALLALGADPNRKSDWWAGGFHALYGASPRVAERLIAGGAVPDACAAAHMDDLDRLRALLAEDPGRVHERGGDGQTPLHFARSRAVADLLLASGADIDARDVDHRSTPAEWMLDYDADQSRSRRPLARYLVERGAAADIFLAASLGITDRALPMAAADPALLALHTGEGTYAERRPSSYHIYFWTIGPFVTPLQGAARAGHRETVDALAPLASPAQQLLAYAELGDIRAAERLVAQHHGLVPSLGAHDRLALVDAARRGNAPAVALMLALGFDPAAKATPKDPTALHSAAWAGSVDAVAALLAHPAGRALVTAREGMYGGMPLDWCCHGSAQHRRRAGDYVRVAELLLGAGAPVPEGTVGAPEVAAVIESRRSASH